MASHCIVFVTCVVLWLAMVFGSCSTHSLSIQQHLKRLNKPATITIKSPDGDMIDCIPISQQPAFDHPLLKDHKIQMQPESFAEKPLRKVKAVQEGQLWHRVGLSCPEGTIPIRRTTESDLLRSKSQMHNYGRKFHHPRKPSASPIAFSNPISGHEYAIGYVQEGQYYGAKANIDVWNPNVQVDTDEFSLSQIWVTGGSYNTTLNTIEAGWQVSPKIYGDSNTRLFIYWTSDSYQSTGCYNLLCSGFVQVSNEIAMGGTISPVSLYADQQYNITILIWKDPIDGNWWMEFGNKYILGYWPATLFTFLSKSASMVKWGGEVVNSQQGGEHTSTQMGSGHFPSEGFGKSSYFSQLFTVDATNNLLPASVLYTYADHPMCYDVKGSSSIDWGSYFFYGGPGKNQNCI